MKQLLRERVWFPNMNKAVEELISTCLACQVTTKPRTHGEVHTSEIPSKPWQLISVDFFGPFENSIYLLHLCDEFSRYPFIEEIKSTSAEAVIPVLSRIFSMFGTPEKLKSDNGPPFNGSHFATFARHYGFKHQKVTPLWPRANGLNERMMQNISKIITAAMIEGKKWRTELSKFLMSYRSTPHCTTGVAPAQLMFNYNANTTRLPQIDEPIDRGKLEERAKANHEKTREKVNKHRNQHIHENMFKVGDHALVRQKKTSKLTPPYDPSTYKITNIKGTMITGTREDHSITRNASLFKKVNFAEPVHNVTLCLKIAEALSKQQQPPNEQQQPQNEQQQEPRQITNDIPNQEEEISFERDQEENIGEDNIQRQDESNNADDQPNEAEQNNPLIEQEGEGNVTTRKSTRSSHPVNHLQIKHNSHKSYC